MTKRTPKTWAAAALSIAVLGVPGRVSSAVEAQAPQPQIQSPAGNPGGLVVRVGRWLGDPAKKRKGPRGFDLAFRLVGSRFDGTFGIEGVPQNAPEGEPFNVQLKLTNIGAKDIKIAAVTVTGDGLALATELVTRRIEPKSSATVATFKIPPQSSAGSSFVISVIQSNGDRHSASLSFSRPS